MRKFLYRLVAVAIVLSTQAASAMICPTGFKTPDSIKEFVSRNSDVSLGATGGVEIKNEDLNADGVKDVIAYPLYSCGNAGCDNYLFLKSKKGSYSYSGHAFFHHDTFTTLTGAGPFQVFGIIAYLRSNADEGALVRYENYGCMMEKVSEVTASGETLIKFIQPPVRHMM